MGLDLDLDNLAESLAFSVSYEKLIDFVLELDGRVADWDFTRELHKRLGEELSEWT
jgi:hypothetical protein